MKLSASIRENRGERPHQNNWRIPAKDRKNPTANASRFRTAACPDPILPLHAPSKSHMGLSFGRNCPVPAALP